MSDLTPDEEAKVAAQFHYADHVGRSAAIEDFVRGAAWERGRRVSPVTREGAITIPRPHVPHGPIGIPENVADADYLREAAKHIEGGFKVGGSNLSATVIKMLRDSADALLSVSPPAEVETDHERETLRLINDALDQVRKSARTEERIDQTTQAIRAFAEVRAARQIESNRKLFGPVTPGEGKEQ